MKRTPINKISKKRNSEMMAYNLLVAKLRVLCNNQSELTGASPDWQSDYLVEPHHIQGRSGKLYLDPFNLILITRQEHDIQGGRVKGYKYSKEELLNHIRPIRMRQEFLLKGS
jgi:hypothetical protein